MALEPDYLHQSHWKLYKNGIGLLGFRIETMKKNPCRSFKHCIFVRTQSQASCRTLFQPLYNNIVDSAIPLASGSYGLVDLGCSTQRTQPFAQSSDFRASIKTYGHLRNHDTSAGNHHRQKKGLSRCKEARKVRRTLLSYPS